MTDRGPVHVVDPNSRMIDDSGPAKPPAGDETAGDESTGGFPWRSLLLPAVLFVLVSAQAPDSSFRQAVSGASSMDPG